MQAAQEYTDLVDLMRWIDDRTSGIALPTDERSMLASGCFDAALEYQAAIALLHGSELPAPMMALLRILVESVVRGIWLLNVATEAELRDFKKGIVKKKFKTLIDEFEAKGEQGNTVLSNFKVRSWDALNGFTHTGMMQVSRRHRPGRVEANYTDKDIGQALNIAGVFGMVAAGQLIAMSDKSESLPAFMERIKQYASTHQSASKC